MTYATDRGFKVGDKVVDIDVDQEIFVFAVDDDTMVPWFTNEDGDRVALHLDTVKLYKEELSIENLIQKRNEAKKTLIKAQQELDEKLEALGLQGKDNPVFPKQSENFEWEESNWREFEVGDEIKVDESNLAGGRNIFFGQVLLKKNPQCCGYEAYPLFVKNNETQYKKWIESLRFMYKKVYK